MEEGKSLRLTQAWVGEPKGCLSFSTWPPDFGMPGPRASADVHGDLGSERLGAYEEWGEGEKREMGIECLLIPFSLLVCMNVGDLRVWG